MQCVKIGRVPAGNETHRSQEHFLGCLFLSLNVELSGLAHLLQPQDLQRERQIERDAHKQHMLQDIDHPVLI